MQAKPPSGMQRQYDASAEWQYDASAERQYDASAEWQYDASAERQYDASAEWQSAREAGHASPCLDCNHA